jgi:hypothetical protein
MAVKKLLSMRTKTQIKRVLGLGGAAALFVGGNTPVWADSLSINFEPPTYSPISIDGQNGWGGQDGPGNTRGPINPLIDQTVVTNGPGAPSSFGLQSWRISNAYTSGTFGDMPFSPNLVNEAGETHAFNSFAGVQYSGGIRQNHFDMQLSFTSADPTGLETDSYVSISPDRGDGARMSYIRLEDHPAGLSVFFDDYQDKFPYGSYGNTATAADGCNTAQGDDFYEYLVASGLARATAHTVRLSIDFKDGPRNDVVKVYVDGDLKHTGTTWEDYFRWCGESNGGIATGNPNREQSRTVDQVLFRVGSVTQGETHPKNRGKGFLIDNLSYSSSTTQQECDNHHGDGDADVQDGGGGHGHAKFHKDGCSSQGSDNAQFDNDQQGQHFQSTTVESADFTTTADGGHSMTMTGFGLHNGSPVGFTLVAVDNGLLVPATYSVVLTDGYAFAGAVISGVVTVT